MGYATARTLIDCQAPLTSEWGVRSAVLTVGRSLPVYLNIRTYSVSAATSQKCQEETSHTWLDYACVATVKVLRDVLTSADRDKRKLLKIAGG